MDDSGFETPQKKIYETPVKRRKTLQERPTKIKDNVHGLIEVPELCLRIIDTPEFERLRSIRQLGFTHYVYPAARHTRFEHSLGVMYLAGQFVTALQEASPGYCDEKDKLCVQVAGLCHDLGHGAFSHLWEQFVTEAEAREGRKSGWTHEEASQYFFERILDRLDHDLDNQDLLFIKELIKKPSDGNYEGRGAEKRFLYEIVSNEFTGLDVDKMDYLARDAIALDVKSTFQVFRYFAGAKVVWAKGVTRIAVDEKVLEETSELYLDRARLHRKAYQHKTVKVLDRMVKDMLLAADSSLKIINSNEFVKMSRAHENPDDYIQLSDDHVFRGIQFGDCEEARSILQRIVSRNLYVVLYEEDFYEFDISIKDCEMELATIISNLDEPHSVSIKDLAVIFKKIDMGGGVQNPLEEVIYFKTKEGETEKLYYQHPEVMKHRIPTYRRLITVSVICRSTVKCIVSQARDVIEIWGSKLVEKKSVKLVRLIDIFVE